MNAPYALVVFLLMNAHLVTSDDVAPCHSAKSEGEIGCANCSSQ